MRVGERAWPLAEAGAVMMVLPLVGAGTMWEINETGRQGQESETRRNRDKWREVGDGQEIGQRWVREGEQRCNGEGAEWNGVVEDPSAIWYLTIEYNGLISYGWGVMDFFTKGHQQSY